MVAEGHWHAAVNQARSFLEALLVTVRHAVRPGAADKSNDIGLTNGTPFRCYRRSLLEAGFLGVDENELLHYVYGVASAKGSHHGVTSEAWSRLARRMVFTAGQYVIEHYAAWKSTPPGTPATPGDPAAPHSVQPSPDATSSVPHKSRWRRPLSALARMITRRGATVAGLNGSPNITRN